MRKIVPSFILLLLIFGCSKELETEVFTNEEQQKSKYTLDMLSTSDIPSISASLQSNLLNNGLALFLEDESAYQSAFQTSFQSLDFVPSQPRFWIDKSSVIELRNVNGNITYSFKIVSSMPSESVFYNLIVSKPANGYEPEPFVIRYTHADGITRDDYRKQTNKRFKGRITVYSLEKFASINTFSPSSGLSTLGVKDDVSCADIIADDDSTNNKSSGGSGSSGNGGKSYSDDGNYYGDSNSGWSSQGSFGLGGNTGGSSSGGGKPKKIGYVEVGIGVFGKSLESDTKDDGDLKSFSLGSKPLSKDSDCPDADIDIPINDDEKIINELVDKALCVYEKLQELSGGFKNMIKKFDGEFPVSHLKFEMKDLRDNTRAQTIPPGHALNPSSYLVLIQLNNDNSVSGVNYRPNLLTAKTIAHEVIHAEMFRKLLSLANNNGNIDTARLNTMLQNRDYPGMLDYYTRFGLNGFQHQQMAAHYRDVIADMLAEFDNNNHNHQLYMDLAWEGLNHSNLLAWKDAISASERDRINETIKNYINQHKNQECE